MEIKGSARGCRLHDDRGFGKMKKMNRDLTSGSIAAGLWAFAVPLMLGNVLQQLYNLVVEIEENSELDLLI